MAKKARIEDIDSDAIINSFRMDEQAYRRKQKHGRQCIGSTTEGRTAVGRTPTCITSQRRNGTQAQERQAGEDGLRFHVRAGVQCHGKARKTGVHPKGVPRPRILKMLHIIGGNEVTIAGFLDNVLTYHFTQFQDEIAESFKRHMESYNL